MLRFIVPWPCIVNEEILANRIRVPNLWQLVLAYREHGHRMASLDPLTAPIR